MFSPKASLNPELGIYAHSDSSVGAASIDAAAWLHTDTGGVRFGQIEAIYIYICIWTHLFIHVCIRIYIYICLYEEP